MSTRVSPDLARTAEAIAALFHPHVEVALHDLKSGKIVQLWNAFPGRAAGNRSPLTAEFAAGAVGTSVIGPYSFTDAAGRRITSISVPVESGARLLCLNYDRTDIDGALSVLSSLASAIPHRVEPGSDVAGTDWQSRIAASVASWSGARGLTPFALTRDQRLQVVQQLEAEGMFDTRNAVEHVAAALGISRATVYNLRAQAAEAVVPCSSTRVGREGA